MFFNVSKILSIWQSKNTFVSALWWTNYVMETVFLNVISVAQILITNQRKYTPICSMCNNQISGFISLALLQLSALKVLELRRYYELIFVSDHTDVAFKEDLLCLFSGFILVFGVSTRTCLHVHTGFAASPLFTLCLKHSVCGGDYSLWCGLWALQLCRPFTCTKNDITH